MAPQPGDNRAGAAVAMRRVLQTAVLLQFSETAISLGIFTVPLFAPVAALELGVPASMVGWYAAILFVGAVTSSIASSAVIARLGPIRTTQASLVMMALSLALVTAGPIVMFAAGALVAGLSYGTMTPAATQVLSSITPPHRFGLVFSIRQTGNPSGGILAGFLVPLAVNAAGWRAASLAMATMVLLTVPALWALRRVHDAGRTPAAPLRLAHMLAPAREVLASSRLRVVALAGFPCGAMQTCLATFLVALLVEDAGFDLVSAGIAMSIAQVCGMAGRVAWGAASGTWTEGATLFGLLALAMSALAGGTLLLSPEVPRPAVHVFAALFGATATGWGGLYIAEMAQRAVPGGASRAAGGASALSFAGCVLGPMAFAWIVAATGRYGYGFLAIGMTTLLAGLALLFAPGDRRRR